MMPQKMEAVRSRMRNLIRNSLVIVTLSLLSGCAYYNTFYNAQQFYNDAAKERKKRERTQLVELSPEEKLQRQRQGESVEGSAADRPSATEMQNYQKAIEKASSVLEYYPESRWIDDALIMVGECFFYRREYAKAQRKFEEIIKLYPNSEFVPKSHILLGKTYLALREFDAAEKKFREIALNTGFDKEVRQSAEYELASLYFEKENYELAADEYRRTAKESDDPLIRAMSWYRLGECMVQLEQYDQAPAIFRRAIDVSPNEDFKSQATYKLGESQSLIKDYVAATRTFSVLLAKELEVKRIPMIKLQLANNYRLQGNQEAALKWYRNLIEEHKGTDASARSYFALAEIEEYGRGDYPKAKEYYDLVRGEQSTSTVAVTAKERSDNIKLMLELRQSIDELLGIATAKDSTKGKEGEKEKKEELDDAPIDLGSDGMWVNYAGRGRYAPQSISSETLASLTGAEPHSGATGGADSTLGAAAVPDSVLEQIAREAAAKKKSVTLAEKRLTLGELLMFSFDRPDSSMRLFLQVVEGKPDSALTARALYSIGYIMYAIKKDTVHADSLFRGLVYLYPHSPHAEGARKILGWPLLSDKIDTAGIIYRQAEKAWWEEKNASRALQLYDSIAVSYPESPFAIKAQYGKGWLYENGLNDYEAAITTYKLIAERYPDTDYGKHVKNKLSRHEQTIQANLAREKAIADSIKLAAEKPAGGGDSLQTVALDSAALAAAGVVPDSSAAAADSSGGTAPLLIGQPGSAVAADSLGAAVMAADSSGASTASPTAPAAAAGQAAPDQGGLPAETPDDDRQYLERRQKGKDQAPSSAANPAKPAPGEAPLSPDSDKAAPDGKTVKPKPAPRIIQE